MGCEWCPSGLGLYCEGPTGIDDLEVGCDCDCHRCEDCGEAWCECEEIGTLEEIEEREECYPHDISPTPPGGGQP